MFESKEARILAEFCDKGSLQNYKETLKMVFDKIWMSGCQIAAREDCDLSSHSFDEGRCIIRISLSKKYDDPIEIIWNILHEFGHHLSGDIDKAKLSDATTQLEREINAWKLARIEALLHPLLSVKISDFDQYKKKCLKGYEKAAALYGENSQNGK